MDKHSGAREGGRTSCRRWVDWRRAAGGERSARRATGVVPSEMISRRRIDGERKTASEKNFKELYLAKKKKKNTT